MSLDWDERSVAKIFDEMAEEYDEIRDPWYSWLFSRLHLLLLQFLLRGTSRNHRTCLDVGCGTGFQSLLLALSGFQVEGVDISYNLLRRAHEKNVRVYESIDLFYSPYQFAREYSGKLRYLARMIRGDGPIGNVSFRAASATALPYADEKFDILSCCGSTLSLIEAYQSAIAEFARVLRPGGILLLEVENKYNLDLLWPFVDVLTLGKLGYGQSLRESTRNLLSSPRAHLRSLFPFTSHEGEILMPMWLFNSRTLRTDLWRAGIEIKEIHAIHSVTNLLPSVTLDDPDFSESMARIFTLLTKAESCVGSIFPFNRIGCSSVLFGFKRFG